MIKLIKKIFNEQELPKIFIRFYAVGLLLFIIPYTRKFFFSITSFSLLFVMACVFSYHKKWNLKTILFFVFIAVSSFLLEVLGVNTGNVFGTYTYDISLGIKVCNTPLLIGLNWVFLVYASQSIIFSFTSNYVLRILGGTLLMLGYDIILELAAPSMQMWHFNSSYPPLDNFIVWFLAAIFYHTLMVVFKISTKNKSAAALFWIQIVFFALISTFSLIVL